MKSKFSTIPKTKIIATIGPATSSPKSILNLIQAGANALRLNLSHLDFEKAANFIAIIRKQAEKAKKTVAIMIDLPGPKFRLGAIETPITIKKGERVVFSQKKLCVKGYTCLPHNIPDLHKYLHKNSRIFVNDGFMQFRVTSIEGDVVYAKSLSSGIVRSNKGVNLPDADLPFGGLTEYDKECIAFGVKHKVDIICVSFVATPEDIMLAKELAVEEGYAPAVIAKIERKKALTNLEDIIKASDGIMVARGDLGVELNLQDVPAAQKEIILKSNLLGRPVIVATQMMESMVEHIRPTRAEIMDVSNAIIDGADAIMFSEETAVGKYPILVIKTAAKIAKATERELFRPERISSAALHYIKNSKRVDDIISMATLNVLASNTIKYVVAPTKTGSTPRKIARLRPRQWIIAITDNETVRNALNISFGIYPMFMSRLGIVGDDFIAFLKGNGLVAKGDRITVTSGFPFGVPGKTNGLRIFEAE